MATKRETTLLNFLVALANDPDRREQWATETDLAKRYENSGLDDTQIRALESRDVNTIRSQICTEELDRLPEMINMPGGGAIYIPPHITTIVAMIMHVHVLSK